MREHTCAGMYDVSCDACHQLRHAPRPHDKLESFDAGDNCPVHDTPHRKVYTFGSSMSAETDVCTFKGCKCAVAIRHDPVGTYPSSATYHDSYESAAGVGKLRAYDYATRYR